MPLSALPKMEKWLNGFTTDFKSMLETHLESIQLEVMDAFDIGLEDPKAAVLTQALLSRTVMFIALLHMNLENTAQDFMLHGYFLWPDATCLETGKDLDVGHLDHFGDCTSRL
jgi:hypothetical protein